MYEWYIYVEIHDHRGHIHHVGCTINIAKNPRCHCLDKEIDQLKHSKKSTDFIKFSSWKQSGYKDKWLVAYKTLKPFFFFFFVFLRRLQTRKVWNIYWFFVVRIVMKLILFFLYLSNKNSRNLNLMNDNPN